MNFYRFFLDGVLMDPQPRGWQGLIDSIDRDQETNGIFHIQDVELEFYGQMYYSLKTLFETSINNRRDILIQENRNGNWIDYYTGHMFLTQAEFYPDTKICKCKILDNSYYSKIKNNQSIDFSIDVGRSKNDIEFTVAADYQVLFFNPCTAGYDGNLRHCVTVYEAFRAFIAFLTDDTVDFDSTYFGPGGEMEGLVITSGAKLSSGDPLVYAYGIPYIPKFSFSKLYSEIKKKRNIGMRVDNSGTRPKVWIEKADDLFLTEEIDHLRNVTGIKMKYDLSRTYSQLEIGCNNTLIGAGCPGLAFPEEIDWLGCKSEKYSISSETNIDNTLSIVSDWIVSSNIIQDCVVNGNHDYDESIFLVMTENIAPGVGAAIQYNNFGYATPTPRFYNQPLMNDQVAESYLRAVPNAISNLYPVSDDTMRATRSANDYLELDHNTPTDVYTPVNYDDDFTAPNHDVNGRFNLVTDRYTASLGGAYTFHITQTFEITDFQSLAQNNIVLNYLVVIIRMNVYSAASVLKLTYEKFTHRAFYIATFVINEDFTVYMAATDYAIVEIELRLGGSYNGASFVRCYIRGGIIKCMSAITAGGVYKTYDPDQYPAFLFDLEYPLTPDRIDSIISNPHKAIRIDNGGDESWAIWIENMKYNRKTGRASITGIASKELLSQ